MVGLFLKNVFRTIWQGAIVDVAATLIAITIGSIGQIHALLYWYLTGVVLGAVGGFFLCILLGYKAAEHDSYNYGTSDPHKVKLPLFLLLLISVASVVCLIVFWNTLTEILSFDNSTAEFFMCVATGLGVYTVFPFMFAFLINGAYGFYQCPHCDRLFCVSRRYNSSNTRQSTQYKTETNRERVGSIEADGVSVADVYGDVKTDYYRTVTDTVDHYNCKCGECGYEWYAHIRHRTKGEWK